MIDTARTYLGALELFDATAGGCTGAASHICGDLRQIDGKEFFDGVRKDTTGDR
jgi:hypothetical protein